MAKAETTGIREHRSRTRVHKREFRKRMKAAQKEWNEEQYKNIEKDMLS